MSSLLFILTYDDVCKDISADSKILLFADDLKIFRKITCISDCYQLQHDINLIKEKLHLIGLSFHPLKSKQLTISRNKSNNLDFTYKMGDIDIEKVSYHKDLGFILDEDFIFKKHRADMVKRAFKKLGLIIRFGKYVEDIDVLRTLFLSLVRSTVEYGSVVWNPDSKEASKSIEKIQSTFIRYLFKKENGFYPKYPEAISYKTLLEMINLNSLETRRKLDTIMLVYKLLNNHIQCSNLQEKIEKKTPNPLLRNRTIEPFTVPHPRFTKLHESPLVKAMTLCNNLHIDITEFSLPRGMFKLKYSNYLQQENQR